MRRVSRTHPTSFGEVLARGRLACVSFSSRWGRMRHRWRVSLHVLESLNDMKMT